MRKRFRIATAVICILLAYATVSLRVFHPYHRTVSLLFCAVALVMLLLAVRRQRRRLLRRELRLRRQFIAYAPHAVVAVVLAACMWAAWVLVPAEPSPLTGMSTEELRDNINTDLLTLDNINAGMDRLMARVETSPVIRRDVARMDPADRRALRDSWEEYLALSLEYDLLKHKYKGFYQVDYVASPSLHADAFFLAYEAFISQYESALRLVSVAEQNATVEPILNEYTPTHGKDSFFAIKQRLTQPEELVRLNAGISYLTLVDRSITFETQRVAGLRKTARSVYRKLGKDPDLLLDNPLDRFEKLAFSFWYPLQKGVALQMSNIRTTDRESFITPELLAPHKVALQPCDILVERRNWYLTNVGIPGFWPHAALYLGSFAELDTWLAGVAVPGAVKPSQYFAGKYPDACDAWTTADDNGFTRNVIESKRPGVIFTSLEDSAHADYLAAMRPRISRDECFRIIDRALSYWGKPYDFNFDFVTDDAIVCSELVYKAFQATDSVRFEPEMISGRLMLPPNLLVKKFDEEYGEPAQQLDFVLFLEGNEALQTVVQRERIDFRRSWKRPKWDVAQE